MFNKLYIDKLEITDEKIIDHFSCWQKQSILLYNQKSTIILDSNYKNDIEKGYNFLANIVYLGNLGQKNFLDSFSDIEDIISDIIDVKSKEQILNLYFPYEEFYDIVVDLSCHKNIQSINLDLLIYSVFYYSENFRLFRVWEIMGSTSPNKKYSNKLSYLISKTIKHYNSGKDTAMALFSRQLLDNLLINDVVNVETLLEYIESTANHDLPKLNKFYLNMIIQSVIYKSSENYKPNDPNYLSDGECAKLLVPLINFIFKISGQGNRAVVLEVDFFNSSYYGTYKSYNEYCRQFVKSTIS